MWPPEGGHKYYISNRPLFKNIIKNSIVWSVNNPTPQVFPPTPFKYNSLPNIRYRMETYFWSNENGSHHQVNVSYLWLHLIPTLFTFPCYTKPLQKSLLCYAVLEIVPVLVWQNADCHLQSCHNQGHFASLVPLRGATHP